MTARTRRASVRRGATAASLVAVLGITAGCAAQRLGSAGAPETASSAGTPRTVAASSASPAPSGRLSVGQLTVRPDAPDDASCPSTFRGGELVDAAGGGFAPHAGVTVVVNADRNTAITLETSANSSGDIAVTLQLPPELTGVPVDGGSLAAVDATGLGDVGGRREDTALLHVGRLDGSCGGTIVPSLTVALFELGGSGASAAAAFAITGPGLPPLSTAASGGFAEVDTDDSGAAVCPSHEPAGIWCRDGAVGPLQVGAVYTATEVTPPPRTPALPPMQVTIAAGAAPTVVAFVHSSGSAG